MSIEQAGKRLWNRRIMPGWFAITTDTRRPEYPEDIEIERGQRELREALPVGLMQKDPNYARFIRFVYEAGIASLRKKRFDSEFSEYGPLQFALGIFTHSIRGSWGREVFGILQDQAKREPNALRDLLN